MKLPDLKARGKLRLSNLRLINLLTFVMFAAFIGWASFAEIDQITRAQGQVIASSRTQLVQSPEGGIIEDLLVKQGDVVEVGQLLARLEKARTEAAFLETRAKSAALKATVARLRAEVFGGTPFFPPELKNYPHFIENQQQLLTKRRAAVNEEIDALYEVLELARKELKMNEPLLKRGDVSMAEILRLQRQVADVQGQITNRKNRYFQEAQAELNKAEEELAGVDQIVAQRKEQLSYMELRAPMRGVVKNVRTTTRGAVLRPGEELLQIVPLEDALIFEARVRPGDVGFLWPGLEASIKVDAYDYTVFGSLRGKLTYISPDTLDEGLKQGEQPYFRVQVTTENRRFSGRPNENIDIQPGMTASVEIKTGSNTVLRYLIKPVIKTVSESMGER